MKSSIAPGVCRLPAAGRVRASLIAVMLVAALYAAEPVSAQMLPPPSAEPAPPPGARSDPRNAANAIRQARRLLAEGSFQMVIEAAEKAGERHPHRVELSFLSAVALSRLGRTNEAIEAFEQLSGQYPELAEPHNNLGVLYAERNELNRARAALEAAVRAQADYAMAHENLGDVLLRLAQREYERAGRSTANSQSAERKLELTNELIGRLAPIAPTRKQ